MKPRLVILLLLSGFLASAQEKLVWTTDTAVHLLGDPFELRTRLNPPDSAALYLVLPDSLGPLTVVDSLRLEKTEAGSLVVLKVAVLDSGYFAFPPVLVVVNGDSLETEPVLLRSGFPAVKEGVEKEDIAPPVEAPRDWRFIYLLAGALLIIALLIYSIRYFRGHRLNLPPAPPKRTPLEKALEELQAVTAWPRNSREEHNAFYTELLDILRRYLVASRHWPALEATGPELLELLERSSTERPLRSEWKAFLELATLVKYAKALPLEAEALRHTEWMESRLKTLDTEQHGTV